jgi:cell division protein FtsB
MSPTIKERSLGLPQFIAVLVVVVAVFFAWDFGHHILDTLQLVQAAQQADLKLAEVEETNRELTQLKADASTDAFVEKKARIDLHYARDNETIFVPAATPSTAAAPTPQPSTPVTATHSFWQDLLEAIFGPSPQ